jgi:hypothetical protein
VCGGLYFFAIDKGKDAPRRVLHPEAAVPLAGRAAVAAAMRKPAYWGLMLAWISCAVAFSSLTYHFYPLLLERGLDSTRAGWHRRTTPAPRPSGSRRTGTRPRRWGR